MEEKEPDHILKPGIPEALDPAIGNGALWETQWHHRQLRSVDTLKGLDSMLLDKDEREKIIQGWSNPMEALPVKESSAPEEEVSSSTSREEIVESSDGVNVREELTPAPQNPEPEEETSAPGIETIEPVPQSSEDKTQPEIEIPVEDVTPISKVGKRVRKVVKKARQESDPVPDSGPDRTESVGDEPLSSFTRWLKGLRGSEYVHPYEDDYGLEQMSSAARGGVSETFADLLAAQGYRDKAIEMYMQLMEKYPEKSSFFAAKIEALK